MQLTRHAKSAGRCSGCSSRKTAVAVRPTLLRQSSHSSLPSQARDLRCLCQTISSDPEADQDFCLQLSPAGAEELQRDQQWLSGLIAAWLDEEWTPLGVHQQLGQAAGAAYVTCRQQGDDDMASLVLGLSNELLAFDYQETFVNAFEVANKVVEVLMMRSGLAVCCTSDEDVERLQRFSSSGSTGGAAQDHS